MILATLQLDGVGHPLLWLIALAGGGWLLFRIYREIYRRTEHRLTWWLMGLRGLGLLALVIFLAKPTWVDRSEQIDPGRLGVILDDSRSMSLPLPDGGSRYARARQAIDIIRDGVEGQRDGPRVEVDLLDLTGNPLPDGPPADPAGERTDISRGLSQALARLRSKPLVGIVLVSDGVDNTGREEMFAAADAPVPIYTVGFRADDRERDLDLAIRRIDAPVRVMVNNTAKIQVAIDKSAGPATAAMVTVKRGRDRFARQQVDLPAGEVEQVVALNITPAEAGRFVFTVTVEADTGEKLLTNNTRQFALQVDAEAIRVFYIEGFLRYEYKFLKNRLEDDPDISVVSIVRRANPERDPAASGGEFLTPERLDNFEVVILGDMEGSYLADSEYRSLLDWINNGHALMVLGGYRSFGLDGFRSTPLADALPAVFADRAPFQNEDPFSLQLTEAGRQHAMFEISGDRVQDNAFWDSAPQLSGCSIIDRAKPGAEVLAVNPNFIRDGKPLPVALAQRYGSGRTLVLAVDTTWRWSRLTRVLGQADTLFARFWSQTVRWLAGRDPETERPPLVVSTDRPDYAVGAPVTIRARRQAAGEVRVEVTGPGGESVPVQMSSGSAEPDMMTGKVYPSVSGRHEVSATLQDGDTLVANQAVDFLVTGADLELADTRTDNRRLQSLASASGGLYYDIDDVAELADNIDRWDRRMQRVRRAEFWNSPWLFLFFLAAVTAEWVMRRRNHLV